MRHGDVILIYNDVTDQRTAVLFFYLSHGLVRVFVINVSHMGKNNGNHRMSLLSNSDNFFCEDPNTTKSGPSCLQEGTVSEASILFTNVFIKFAKLCIPNKTIVVREDDKPWYDSEIRRNSRKRDRLKKTALKTGNPNDWKKYKMFRNLVNNQKNMRRNLFYNNLGIIVSDFQNNDKRKFWNVIRHFVKRNSSASPIPPVC